MKAIVTFAEGFETVEALMTVDILRRAGVEVTMASISDDLTVTSAQKIPIVTDSLLSDEDAGAYDIIILPGGMPGTTHLGESADVKDAVYKVYEAGKYIAAICAAPTVFGGYGLLQGKHACCYPGLEGKLTGAEVTYDKVTVDGKIITSRGLGTALDFALAIVSELISAEKAAEIKTSVVAD